MIPQQERTYHTLVVDIIQIMRSAPDGAPRHALPGCADSGPLPFMEHWPPPERARQAGQAHKTRTPRKGRCLFRDGVQDDRTETQNRAGRQAGGLDESTR